MNLSPRERAFFLIVLKYHQQDAETFFSYLRKAQEKAEMKSLYQELANLPEHSVQRTIDSELMRLASPSYLSFLSDVHDDWIIDLLKEEMPAMIATILRYLPAERVNVLLRELPENVVQHMPRLSNVYAISRDLVELLKVRFEHCFMLNRVVPKTNLEFEHFCLLKSGQIHRIFFELGYQEIAAGFLSLPEDARMAVMERLSVVDRQHVDLWIQNHTSLSQHRLKRAPFHLVNKDIGHTPQVSFIKELGFVIYAKSLLARDKNDVGILIKKMSRIEARCLQKLIAPCVDKNTEATVLPYREDLLSTVKIVLEGKK